MTRVPRNVPLRPRDQPFWQSRMRSSLQGYLTAICCIAISAGMLIAYELLGIIFAAINCVVFVILLRMFLRRRAFAITIGLLYIACWGLTVVESRSVRDDALSKLAASLDGLSQVPTHPVRFGVDPVVLNRPEQLDAPWYYVGSASVPCPFVIVFDHAMMTETWGRGGRMYLISVCGYSWYAWDVGRWVHC